VFARIDVNGDELAIVVTRKHGFDVSLIDGVAAPRELLLVVSAFVVDIEGLRDNPDRQTCAHCIGE
jgi:hypothetical protein